MLSSLALLFAGCTRPTASNVSTLSITVPGTSQISDLLSVVHQSNVARTKDTTFSVSTPTSASQINCYFIFINQPELNSTSQCSWGTQAAIPVSTVYGSVYQGTTLSVDVPSGSNRSISIVGVQTSAGTSASCPTMSSFNNSSVSFSKPVYLGSLNSVNMSPGDTINVNIPITQTIVPSQQEINCNGPTFPGSGGGGGNYLLANISPVSGGGNYNYQNAILTNGACYQVSVGSYQGSGSSFAVTGSALSFTLTGGTAGIFYPTNTCNSTAIGSTYSGTIAVGSSQTAAPVFFKPTTNGASYAWSFSGITGAGGTSYQNNTNAFSVNSAQLKTNLPSTIIPNVCYPFQVSLVDASGFQPISTTTMNFTLGTSIGTYYSDGYCGMMATPLAGTISGSNSPTYSFQTTSFSSFTPTITAVSGGSFSIQTPALSTITIGGGANVVDGVQFVNSSSNSSNIEPGFCTPLMLSLTNAQNVVIPGQALNILLSADPNMHAVFYSDSACGSTLLDNQIVFPAGQGQYTIFVIANSNSVTGKFYATIYGSDLDTTKRIAYASSSYTVGSPFSNDPWVYPSVPVGWYKASFIGSHEFPASIAFNTSSGSTLTCSGCSGGFNTSTGVATVSMADYSSGITVTASNGSATRSYILALPRINAGQTIVNCSSVVSANAVLFPAGANVCVNSGIVISLAAAANMDGRSVIGWSDQSSVINLSGSSTNISFGTNGGNLSNWTISSVGSTGSGDIYFTGSTVQGFLTNLTIASGSSGTSIKTSNDSAIINIYDVLMAYTGGSTPYGIYGDSANLNIKRLKAAFPNGISLASSLTSSSLTLFNSTITSTSATYNGSDSFPNAANPTFKNASFFPTATSIEALYLPVGSTTSMVQSVVSNLNQYVFNLQSGSTTTSIALINNILIQKASNVVFNDSLPSPGTSIVLEGNHFIKLANGAPYFINLTSGSITTSSVNSNHVCSDNSSDFWAGLLSGSATGTFLSTNAPSLTNGNGNLSSTGLCAQ